MRKRKSWKAKPRHSVESIQGWETKIDPERFIIASGPIGKETVLGGSGFRVWDVKS